MTGSGDDPGESAPIPQPGLFPRSAFSTEVMLIRHGRSADVVLGSPESHDPPLHEEGVAQAAALAARLAPKRLDAVYSSDLARARQTALPLAHARGLTVHEREDLREVHLGDWSEGEFRRRAAIADPEWVEWSRSGRWDGIPGGEGDDAFRARVNGAVRDIVATNEGSNIAIVCHGGVINAFLADLYGSHRSFCATIENTSITLVRVSEPRWTVLAVNDCAHLYDIVVSPL